MLLVVFSASLALIGEDKVRASCPDIGTSLCAARVLIEQCIWWPSARISSKPNLRYQHLQALIEPM